MPKTKQSSAPRDPYGSIGPGIISGGVIGDPGSLRFFQQDDSGKWSFIDDPNLGLGGEEPLHGEAYSYAKKYQKGILQALNSGAIKRSQYLDMPLGNDEGATRDLPDIYAPGLLKNPFASMHDTPIQIGAPTRNGNKISWDHAPGGVRNPREVIYDPVYGYVTPSMNLYDDSGFGLGSIMSMVPQVGFSAMLGGALGPAVGGALGTSSGVGSGIVNTALRFAQGNKPGLPRSVSPGMVRSGLNFLGYKDGGTIQSDGYVRGHGSPRGDNIPTMTPLGRTIMTSPTEYVLNADQVKRAGGPRNIERMFGPAGGGKRSPITLDGIFGYEDGGPVDPVGSFSTDPSAKAPTSTPSSGGVNNILDFIGGGLNLAQGINPNLFGLGVDPQQAQQIADPFASQRPIYQPMLRQSVTNQPGLMTQVQGQIGDQLTNKPGIINQTRKQIGDLIADPSSITKLPSYQFNLDQGINAIDRSSAASGGLYSGNRAYELEKFGKGLASNTYNQQLNNLMNVFGQQSTAYNADLGTLSNLFTGQGQQYNSTNRLLAMLSGAGVDPSSGFDALNRSQQNRRHDIGSGITSLTRGLGGLIGSGSVLNNLLNKGSSVGGANPFSPFTDYTPGDPIDITDIPPNDFSDVTADQLGINPGDDTGAGIDITNLPTNDFSGITGTDLGLGDGLDGFDWSQVV